MKKFILAVLTLLAVGCSEDNTKDIYKPTFEVVSFEKVATSDGFVCEVEIRIQELRTDYAIDGLLYNDSIIDLSVEVPNYIKYTITSERLEEKSKLTIVGKAPGELLIKIKFISHRDKGNYLIGWHLAYGFTDDCELMMINLKI